MRRAAAAWGQVPDWVKALLQAMEAMPQKTIASRLGYSSSAITNVIRRKYSGNLALLEAAVRGLLMGETCRCPVLEDISKLVCVDHQRRARWHRPAADPIRRMLFEACRSCPNSFLKKGSRT
jgi:hypothetical protein